MLEHLAIQMGYHTMLILQLAGCLILLVVALCGVVWVTLYATGFTYESSIYLINLYFKRKWK